MDEYEEMLFENRLRNSVGSDVLFASCHSAYEVTKAEGRMQPIDSTYDVAPDAEAMALLAPQGEDRQVWCTG